MGYLMVLLATNPVSMGVIENKMTNPAVLFINIQSPAGMLRVKSKFSGSHHVRWHQIVMVVGPSDAAKTRGC